MVDQQAKKDLQKGKGNAITIILIIIFGANSGYYRFIFNGGDKDCAMMAYILVGYFNTEYLAVTIERRGTAGRPNLTDFQADSLKKYLVFCTLPNNSTQLIFHFPFPYTPFSHEYLGTR